SRLRLAAGLRMGQAHRRARADGRGVRRHAACTTPARSAVPLHEQDHRGRGPVSGMAVGSAVVAEYDVPDDAWYFADNAAPPMPTAALMEIALQPCGWLGCYVGSPVQIDAELLFRNLDGDVRVLREVRPGTRVVRTRAELTDVSRAAGMIIEIFRIECHADGEPLLRGT